ncbi:MAG: ATP-binding protein [Thermodesulfobacteriota bacterium]
MELRVEDTGPGVPPGEADRIFEPFYSLRAGGTGLGLSIAHTIVSDHGGHIALESPSGGGAAFSVRLPAAAEAEPAPRAAPQGARG